MTDTIIAVGCVWLFAVLSGLPLYAAMALGATLFVDRAAKNDQCNELLSHHRGPAVHFDG